MASLWRTLDNFVRPLEQLAAQDGIQFLYSCADPPAGDAIPLAINRGLAALQAWPRARNVALALASARADIIHVHTPASALAVLPALRNLRAVLVYTARGGLDEGLGLPTRLAWRLADPATWHSWHAVAVLNQRQYQDILRTSPSRLIVKLSSGGAPSRVVPEAVGPTRRVSRSAPVTLHLGWMGRLDRDKRPLDFVALIDDLNGAGVPSVGVVIGDVLPGDRPPKGIQKTLRDHPWVDWRGWADEPYRHLADCDLFVHTSMREGFGMAPLEAALLGKPCIAYWTRGTAESVLSVAGTLVRAGDRRALVSACRRWARMSAAARSAHSEEVRRRARLRLSDELWKDLYFLYRQASL